MNIIKNTEDKFIRLKILSLEEKKEIEKKLEAQFGIKTIPGLIVKRGKERLFLFTGSFSEREIKELEDSVIIERVGVYFAKIVEDGGEEKIRLSLEGVHILKDQIKKNIFELSEEQADKWMKGQQLDIKTGKRGMIIMKYKENFLGTGKASEEKIGNFIPKSRRVKERVA